MVVFSKAYNVEYPSIKKIVEKHLPTLQLDPLLKDIATKGFRCVARCAPTIGQTLSRSLFCSQNKEKPTWLQHCGTYKCGCNRCLCCKFIEQSTQFKSYVNHTVFKVNGYINCNTSHVEYLISCTMCKVQYVGCTIQKFIF